MNKRFLLIALPAIMALSGCQASLGLKQQQKDNNPVLEMAEDTLAHEEVFGGAENTHAISEHLQPKKAKLTADSVKIGYQIQYNDNNTPADDSDDKISIRFVAALADASVTAVWHRGLAQPNGAEGAEPDHANHPGVWKYKFSGDDVPVDLTSSVIYDALNNGGSRVAAGEGDYIGYEGFAIYTLMNIPYNQFKDSYLAAYVTLTGENTINSKGLAVKVERDGSVSKNRFYFNAGSTYHFLEGTFNGVARDGSDDSTHALVTGNEYGEGGNSADFTDIPMLATDSFGSFYYSAGTCFQFFGYNSFTNGTADIYFEGSGLSEYSKPKYDGTFSIYISRTTENHLFGSTTATRSVTFNCTKDVGDGRGIFVVGEFNNWTVSVAHRLSWTAGNVWTGSFDGIRIGSEVKFVNAKYSDGSDVAWQGGDNLVVGSDGPVSYVWP